MAVDWKTIIGAVLGTALSLAALMFMVNEILFESYMPKSKAHVANVQIQINAKRDEYEPLLKKGKNRTPEEEARYGQLRTRLETLRRSRDRLLGIE